MEIEQFDKLDYSIKTKVFYCGKEVFIKGVDFEERRLKLGKIWVIYSDVGIIPEHKSNSSIFNSPLLQEQDLKNSII